MEDGQHATRIFSCTAATGSLNDGGEVIGNGGGVLVFQTSAGGIGGDGGAGAAVLDGRERDATADGGAFDEGAVEGDVRVVGYCLSVGREWEYE